MKQESFLVILLLIAVLGFASQARYSSSGPLATPPNPDAEFGVVHESASQSGGFSIFGGGSGGSQPSQSGGQAGSKPPPEKSREEKVEALRRSFSLSLSNPRTRDVNNEFIDIHYRGGSDAPDSVNISRWTISNARGESFVLGLTTNIPGIGGIATSENLEQLLIKRGGTVHVITGRSPLGINFRANKCVEYFNQYHTFRPGLPGGCPSPSQEHDLTTVTDRCYLFMRGYGSCVSPRTLPEDLDNACRDLITQTATYSYCIGHHKNDRDFYRDEWWTYLKRPEHIWSDVRDTVTLTDETGTVIATASYD